MKKRTRLIAGVMAMMLTLGGCGSAANTANKKEATQTTAEQTTSSQEDTAEAAAKETELDVLKIGLAALPTQLDPDRSIGIASIKLFYNIFIPCFSRIKKEISPDSWQIAGNGRMIQH